MKRLIISMTGASGAIYGIRALEVLREVNEIETQLIMSPSAQYTITEECGMTVAQVKEMADRVHSYKDVGASVASGSYQNSGMLIAPCTIKSLSGFANCYDDNLIARAADVCLKERRRVVALLRETPFHMGHIKLMERATENGAIIMPPVPAFYHKPQSIDDIVNQTVGRALDLFDLEIDLVKRWKNDR